jgi:hypothetical protein
MIWILPLFLAVIIALIAVYLYPSVCFLQRFRNGKELPFCRESVTRTELHVASAKTSVQIFKPDGKSNATLMIVPGLHPHGIHDPRFQAFAASCAEAGFTVVAADIIEFRKFQITPNSVLLISQLVNALPTLVSEEALQNVGLLGISYGGGPVLIVASQKEMRGKIHFVVSIGGYYDLLHAMEYSITGKHPEAGTPPPPPHQWGRMIFALNHLEFLAPATDAPLLHQILTLRLNLKEEEAKEYEEGLSASGKEFLAEVLNGLTPDEMDQFKKMIVMHSEVSRKLSPEFFVADFPPDLRIYLIHGPGDSLIPSAESEELVAALNKSHHSKTYSLITPTLDHVDPAKKESWSDQMGLILWTRKFLGEAKR